MHYFCDFPDSPVVKTALSMQGAQVQSLEGDLRSPVLRGVAKKLKLPTLPLKQHINKGNCFETFLIKIQIFPQ